MSAQNQVGNQIKLDFLQDNEQELLMQKTSSPQLDISMNQTPERHKSLSSTMKVFPS